MLCDLIKLNKNTIYFVSSSKEKKGLNIIAFNLYDNDNYLNIRYFSIDIWGENSMKFYSDLRLSLYNNFLVMAFSNCEQEKCEGNDDTHFSSLIFFNYPNINKTTFDVINYIYPDNKNIQNETNINFEEYLIIENNLFGYIYKGVKIISYSSEINLMINGKNIDSSQLIEKGKNVQLQFNSEGYYTEGSYNI